MQQKLIFSACLFLLLTACLSEKTTNETPAPLTQPVVTFQQIVDEQLASGIVEESIFLDFKFGMSRQQVSAKVEQMVKNKKLKVQKGKVIYMLDLNDERKETLISPFYEGNLLYELGLNISNARYEDVIELFRQKYADDVQYPVSDTLENYRALYLIKGNRQVKIEDGEDVRVFYTDLRVQKKLGIKEGEKKKKMSKSLKDI